MTFRITYREHRKTLTADVHNYQIVRGADFGLPLPFADYYRCPLADAPEVLFVLASRVQTIETREGTIQ